MDYAEPYDESDNESYDESYAESDFCGCCDDSVLDLAKKSLEKK